MPSPPLLAWTRRIGSKYLKGSVGYGGPCFPRDNVALAALARELDVPAPLPEATDAINRQQVPRLQRYVMAHLPVDGRVGILGVSYKPQTNVIERAQGLELAQALLADQIPVLIYDPCAMESARAVLNGPVQLHRLRRRLRSPGGCGRDLYAVQRVQGDPQPGPGAGSRANYGHRLLASAGPFAGLRRVQLSRARHV